MDQQKPAEPPVELTEENVAIHLKLLKRLRYFDLIVPNSRGTNSWTLFGYNGHRLCFGAAIVVIYTALVYGNCGFFAPVVDYELSDEEFCLVMCADLFLLVNLCNTLTLFYHLPEVTSLMEMTRVDFLTSAACRRNRGSVLSDCRTKVIWFSNVYTTFITFAIVQWIVFADVIDFSGNMVDAYRAADKRVPTIFYMPFPVDVQTHNNYFLVFSTTEMMIIMFSIYSRLMVDLYMVSFGWIISVHYDELARGFEGLGRIIGRRGVGRSTGESKANIGDDERDINVEEDLISILSDQLKLISKFESFNVVARPIILTMVGASSVAIVLLTLVFIMRAAINFGIYSCDWTDMDLKVKKLLLLTMRMNDANSLLIKASPTKLINLELFVSVIKTCYSITSVMGNSLGRKH